MGRLTWGFDPLQWGFLKYFCLVLLVFTCHGPLLQPSNRVVGSVNDQIMNDICCSDSPMGNTGSKRAAFSMNPGSYMASEMISWLGMPAVAQESSRTKNFTIISNNLRAVRIAVKRPF